MLDFFLFRNCLFLLLLEAFLGLFGNCVSISVQKSKKTLLTPPVVIIVVIIVVIVLCVASALAYFNYEIVAKSALLSLYLGFLVSEIWTDYGSDSKNNEQ